MGVERVTHAVSWSRGGGPLDLVRAEVRCKSESLGLGLKSRRCRVPTQLGPPKIFCDRVDRSRVL